jgi:hypothetical protein
MTRLKELLAGSAPAGAGMYRLSSRAAPGRLRREVEEAGWQCFWVDGRGMVDKASFLEAFAGVLRFPGYAGRNWDAFEESVRDLSWLNRELTRGIAVIVDGADRFARAQPEEWAVARDILAGAAASWRQTGAPMIVLLRGAKTAAAGLETLTL